LLEDRLTQSQFRPDEETSARIASQFARAFAELQQSLIAANDTAGAQGELAAARAAIQDLSARLERQLEEDKEQRHLLGDQLAALAGSLDRLVSHLQALSQLMGDLLERLAEPRGATAVVEAPFQPGGEGISLALAAVPGFQALMDIQKALSSMPQVSGASVERYNEGDSRILLHLGAAVTATEIAAWVRSTTPHAVVVEEAKPELSRLRMKVVSADA
jgi:hypothetical protein